MVMQDSIQGQEPTQNDAQHGPNKASTNKMLKWSVGLSLALLGAFALWTATTPGSEVAFENLKEEPVGELVFIDNNGQETDLKSQLDGRHLILNFYASTCAPCRAEMPDLEEVHLANKEEIRLIGLNADTNQASWKAFDAEIGITFETGFEPDRLILKEFGPTSLPTTIFVNSDGVIVRRWSGVLTADTVEDVINKEFGAL